MKISSNGDVSFRDFSLGNSAPTRSLTHADDLVYAALDPEVEVVDTRIGTVHSLSSICVKIFSYNWQKTLNQLQPDHILSARSLLNEVEKVSGDIPFQVFAKFAAMFGTQLPLKRRTFKRLVLEDLKEINSISQLNDEVKEEWRKEKARAVANQNYAKRRNRPYIPVEIESPTFFLSTLDLSYSTFLDNHIHTLKPISSFLAVLRLDYSTLTDIGISFIARGMSEKEEYEKLEILTLRGLKRVSDASASKVTLLPSLRMLDIRATSCTSTFRSILDKRSERPDIQATSWRPARYRSNINKNISLELQLFSESHSSSRLLTFLRSLAATEHSQNANELTEKPITFQITSVSRHIPPTISPIGRTEKTAEELYIEQIALSNSNAAYHSVYGGVTCTTKMARGILNEDAQEEPSNRSAFAERIATGVVNKGIETRNTLFSVGQSKYSTPSSISSDKIPGEALSDWGSDEDDYTDLEIASIIRKRQQQQTQPFFYQSANPPSPPLLPRSKRVPKLAEVSEFMLLRHLPLRHPCEKVSTTIFETESKPVLPILDEGVQLKRKRILPVDLPFRPVSNPSILVNSSSSPSSSNFTTGSSNPFSKKFKSTLSSSNMASSSTTSSKSTLGSVPLKSKLPGRSSLAAFGKRS